jgi:hypothetical protein
LEAERPAQSSRGKKKQEAILPEIAELDREIDRIVYDLYGLTDKEISIIEKSR